MTATVLPTATMSIPQTPTRRSQRFQPTATPSSKISEKNILQCEWVGDPIFTRACNAELDLLAEEREEKAKRDEEDDDDDELETVFYESFKMRRKPTSYRGTKRLKVAQTELQTYRVGDTVMVETDTLYLMKKPPSIGVIVAMWETRRKGDENQGAPTMRVRIHWFLRPTEMASIRAKREHEEVSDRFYCISSTNVFYRTKYTIRCQRESS
jgi:origin recognition complex subunit 1